MGVEDSDKDVSQDTSGKKKNDTLSEKERRHESACILLRCRRKSCNKVRRQREMKRRVDKDSVACCSLPVHSVVLGASHFSVINGREWR